ncbi:hypothetical protein [Profundibacterium mesophilum]|uniref:Uncharacterized protein n=1 Tax=Profundibacterium mesophilum KAUST100406-0324 TaxID=1037889 RepID=A0A921NTG0_9RHOB|nr:hypothetical protein [Profundibacterium mesophilum]KAF0675213.1 hypothetical protein PMES_02476 [Profundibacterium mesophilum KAUST100406-0324]
MEHIQAGTRSIQLICKLNSDRLLYAATIATALAAGAFVGSL